MTKLDGQTLDILQENIKKLRELFPEVAVEDKIDFDKLKQILGEYVDDNRERYNFTWNGKGMALKLSQTPSLGTLRPCLEESKNWDTTENLYIEGDNLEVLKLLQKSYHNKIKMIYIDPPYNTGGDFVYHDDYKDSLENYKRITGQIDDEGNRISSNTEANGRYHTDWLNMIYPRLRLARNLLTDDGVIFISIDENEVSNLRKLCDEIFGEENLISQLGWQKVYSSKNQSTHFSNDYEFILCYSKSVSSFKMRDLPRTYEMNVRYKNPDNDPRGDWKPGDCIGSGVRTNGYYDVVGPTGKIFNAPRGKHWVYAPDTMKDMIADNRIWFGKDGKSFPAVKQFLIEVGGRKASSLLLFKDYGHTDMAKKDLIKLFEDIEKLPFETPKPVKLIKMLSILGSDENDIILDFFAGTGTTAQSVFELNSQNQTKRKFILVQLPEIIKDNKETIDKGILTISDLAKERIRRAGDKIKKKTGFLSDNLDIGFKVFKLDTSNLKKWQPDYDNFEQSLIENIGNFVDGRSELDVVYEIIIKMGLDLTYPVEETVVGGKNVYSVGFGALMMCLDDEITTDVANGMVNLYNELKPETWKVVFKDNGFKSDSNKTNIKEILKCAGLEEDSFTTI